MAQKSDSRSPLLVSYEHASKRENGPGSDLSLGGVFIETATALPVGALLSLEIESGTTKVALDARILSCRAAGGPERPAGIAVSFIDLPNDVAASLHFIIAARAPRKGTMLGLGEAEDDVPTYQSERKLPVVARAPEPDAPPLARPPTPVMDAKAAEAPPSHAPKHPTPQMFQAGTPFVSGAPAPPPSGGPLVAPIASPSWRPATPAVPARDRRGIPTAMLVAGVLLLLVAVAAASWVIRGRVG